MPAITVHCRHAAGKALPYVWGFAIASALDHLLDIQYAFPAALAALAVLSAFCLALRKGAR
jgi:hypothetical protein